MASGKTFKKIVVRFCRILAINFWWTFRSGRETYMIYLDVTTWLYNQFKKKFTFYSKSCKWLERKIQPGICTTHTAWNVLINCEI